MKPRDLTPAELERLKTESARAEDIAYTINHALACTATDFIDPYFGNMTQKYLGRRFSIGCGHDHSHDHHHHHEHDGACAHRHEPQSHLKQWWIGEVVGDFGAVPITVGFQRYLPGFMEGLRGVLEPALGWFFRKGAERSAERWASKQGIERDSAMYKERVEEIYRHEVQHLPQALLWTASSIALNLGTQRWLGNEAPLWHLAAGKAVGASISAGLVVAGRGVAPGLARKWDGFTSENLFLPATKAVGKVFGVEEKAIDRMVEEEEKLTGETWRERVSEGEESKSRAISL